MEGVGQSIIMQGLLKEDLEKARQLLLASSCHKARGGRTERHKIV